MRKRKVANYDIHKIVILRGKTYSQLQKRLGLIMNSNDALPFLRELFFLSQHKDPSVRQSVVEIVKKNIQNSSEKTRNTFLPLVLRGIGDVDCRYEALECLLYYPEENYTYLIGSILLQDDDSSVRVQASDLLATLRDREAIPFLEASLNDKDALVRVYSAYGLALLDSRKSIPKLIRLEAEDRRRTVKTACWGGLLLLTRERVWLERLLRVLKDEDYHIPMQAIDYISNGVEANIVPMEDVAPRIEEYCRAEEREAVSSRMKRFLKLRRM